MTDLPVYTAADVTAEPTIDLPSFDNDDAVQLGLFAVEVIRERELSLAVRVVLRRPPAAGLPRRPSPSDSVNRPCW